MSILYLECTMGAAGDMIMGALLELCPNPDEFINKMNNLGLPGVKISCVEGNSNGLRGTRAVVSIYGKEECAFQPNSNNHCEIGRASCRERV